MKLKDLKALSDLLNETIKNIREKNANYYDNAVLRTIDDANNGINLLLVELEGVERLDDDNDFTDDLESAKNELDDIKDNLYNLERYIKRIDNKTEADLSLRSLEIAIDDLESELDDCEIKELSDDERDDLSVDDLIAKVVNDE
jgi:predicted  nucleic acid-binding Zn-ribbon protein